MQARKQRGSDILKGLAAGLISGLVASVVMNRFQSLWAKRTEGVERSHGAQSLQQGSPRRAVARKLQERSSNTEQDDATERFASALSVGMVRRQLPEPEKDVAGTVSHYGFGNAAAGLYGVAAELVPGMTKGVGLPFGAFIWLAADEGAVPALGLSKSPAEYPLGTHAYALASHLVFGVTAEAVRRLARVIL
jgi:uncharacterized membrane protein YagU involved in acid resistance